MNSDVEDCDDEDNNNNSNDGINYADFAYHVNELNAVLHAEPAQIITEGPNKRTARLAHASDRLDNIKIGFYRNGLMIQRGPFRPRDKAQLLRRLPKTVIRKGQLIDLRAGIEDKLNDNHNPTNNTHQKYTDNSHLWTVNESDSTENGVITNNVNTHNNNKAKYILLSTPASLLASDEIESTDNKKDS
eukprot:CAMPEP_0170106682 /NCGR_PEP_ID=MMETSP0020_2-20130122/5532_1 /TAXON_ID=98059 /ORGANISM="Dinobryon sp., Strain UTEXLB2267" /LENGTH=187 /DNA_ID=CAMNT_0010331081 /DNA_START=443 /DNA_END=1003 /DNA_ORIENTATION=-